VDIGEERGHIPNTKSRGVEKVGLFKWRRELFCGSAEDCTWLKVARGVGVVGAGGPKGCRERPGRFGLVVFLLW